MPILRINAGPSGPVLHGSPACARRVMSTAAKGTGPIIIMVHGYKYDPANPQFCPHRKIFARTSQPNTHHNVQWPVHLGFGDGNSDEGLAVAFAWRARGALWGAHQAALVAGRQLADVILTLKTSAPLRPVHIITHSMGSEVLLSLIHI